MSHLKLSQMLQTQKHNKSKHGSDSNYTYEENILHDVYAKSTAKTYNLSNKITKKDAEEIINSKGKILN